MCDHYDRYFPEESQKQNSSPSTLIEEMAAYQRLYEIVMSKIANLLEEEKRKIHESFDLRLQKLEQKDYK